MKELKTLAARNSMFMKDGKIIEQGNHEELLAKNGAYAQMYRSGMPDYEQS